MNAILKSALAGRKKLIDEKSSTSALGTGSGSITDDKPTTAKLPFYTGGMVDKSPTGFTGLLNQGATCYLNSLLQSLYMTPELRQAVYEWRYDKEKDPEEKRSIPLQLQKLFARLQLSIKGAVYTRDLTTSFGWTGGEVYQQHDVLELSNVLFENLEIQAVNTKLAMVVSDLHRGSYKDYVQCLNCKTMRGRSIPFVGLGLDITESDSFDHAMKKYITPEILDGGNQVNCEKCAAKQDSKKGIKLTSLPYLLSIHLKRWTFNFMTLQRIKLNKKVAFPRKFDGKIYLNSDGFLQNTNEQNKDKNDSDSKPQTNDNDDDDVLEYELYSMMIHTGGATGGHYFAYIKDWNTGNWLQFNDSSVRTIPHKDVEEWFNPPKKEEKEKDEKKENDKDDKDKKEVKAAPAPIPKPKPKPQTNGNGMDIGAAIAQNLKDKKEGKINTKNKKESKLRFLDPYGAAYMLMYRLIDPKRNILNVSADLIPKDIVDEIKKEDEVYAEQKKKYDFLRQFTTFKIHFDNKTHDVMVKKKESLKNALTKIYDELKLSEQGITSIDCIRVRNMKVAMNVPLQPYEGDELNDLVEEFEFHDPKHLILETRKENEEFAKYEKSKISLRMIELDEEKMEWKQEVLIQIEEDAKISILRQECAKKLGVDDANKIRIAYLNEGLALLLSDDEKRIKKDERILNGHYIHVEKCETNHKEGKSKLMDKFDKQLNVLHLFYNQLRVDKNDDIKFDQAIEIDVRTELGTLREILAEKLGLKPSELVLRKGWHQQELKDNKKTLEQYRLHTNGQVFVEKGTPLNPTQYLFQIFIEDQVYIKNKAEKDKKKWDEYLKSEMEKERNAKNDNEDDEKKDDKKDDEKEKTKKKVSPIFAQNKDDDDDLGEAFLYVGDVILDETWTLKKVKQEIVSSIANVPPAHLMRLRSFANKRLTKCYLDSLTLKKNLKGSIKDFLQICCQKTAKEEEMTKDKSLIYVARWYPERMDFGEVIEYSFRKKTKIKSELKEELSKFSGIPLEHLRVAHPRAYYMKKVENRRKICILDWENTDCAENATLVSKPWRCKMGEFILYKDNREKELLTKEDFNTGSISSAFAREERPLIFYSPEQQIIREQEQKKKEEEDKLQREQAQKDAIERMKQSADVAAKKAQIAMEKSMNNNESNK